MKASDLMEVFQAGKMVAKPAFWKQKTIDMNVLVVLISGIVGVLNFFDCSFCSLSLSSEQIIGIATGICALVGVFNAGSTAATSDKVGLKPFVKVEEKPVTYAAKKVASKSAPKVEEAEEEIGEEVSSELNDEISKLQ